MKYLTERRKADADDAQGQAPRRESPDPAGRKYTRRRSIVILDCDVSTDWISLWLDHAGEPAGRAIPRGEQRAGGW
jgi:hypothetical protein